ncbi:hypothetical protein LTR86_002649 [Recurvomyces mirabilis]|nr:hypothetical protein LTR86_002649 [Recurvomyces mirabilis]
MALLTSGPLGRHVAYEVFLSSHLAFAVILVTTLWTHVYAIETLAGVLLITSTSTFLLCLLYQMVCQCYRNIGMSPLDITYIAQAEQTMQEAQNTPVDPGTPVARTKGCLMLKLRLPRPLLVHPGQYVYLTVLSGSLSPFQRHPFVVAWWGSEPKSGLRSNPDSSSTSTGTFNGVQDIYLLIEQQRGWTSYIQRYCPLLPMRRAWLEGPYGPVTKFHRYGCVLLFATGSGLFAVLPIMKRLMELIRRAAAYTQSIRLVWYTDRLYDPMSGWMDELLQADVDKCILQVSIHSKINPANQRSSNFWGQRIRRATDIPDIPGYINETVNDKRIASSKIAIVGTLYIVHLSNGTC